MIINKRKFGKFKQIKLNLTQQRSFVPAATTEIKIFLKTYNICVLRGVEFNETYSEGLRITRAA